MADSPTERDALQELRRACSAWNAYLRDGAVFLRCDAFGCIETHPVDHDMLGDECFGTGRWCGWMYLDLNRPDLFPRELRFCSVTCLQWWVDRETAGGHALAEQRKVTALDRALRNPRDEVARKYLVDLARTVENVG